MRFNQLLAKLIQVLFKPLLRFGINPSIQTTAIWSMLESFSSPLFSLILMPILTHSLGLEKYGLYVMVMAYVSLLSFTGLGMNTAITYYLAVNHQASNVKNIAERLGTAISITLIGTISISLILIFALNLFQTTLQAVYPQLITQQFLVYAALMLLILTQFDMVISAALKGLQQFKASSELEFLIRLIGFFVMALVAIKLKSVTAIVITAVIIAFLSILLRYNTLRKVVNLHLNDIKLNRQYAREFFHFGKWMTLQTVAVALFGSLDKIIVGSLLGNKVVGIYNVMLSITQLIHFLPANMLTFIMPKVAKNSELLSIELFKKIFTITIIISSSIAITIILLKQFIFYKFSIDNSYNILFYWLILCYILLSLNVPSYFVALGMNLIKSVSVQCIMGSIIGILSLLVLVSKYGVLGAVVSKMIYSLVAILLFIPVLNRMRHQTK